MKASEAMPIRMIKTIRIFLLVGAMIWLSACSDDGMSDLQEYVKEVKSREASPIEPSPEYETVESFKLDTTDLRNPFVPTEDTQAREPLNVLNGIKPDIARPREELESYTLDSLRMVGTVTMSANLWGLIEANDGTIHRVQNGNYMGQNHGRIIRILENQIELMEIIPDPAGPGTWREQQATVKLSDQIEEKQ